MAPWTRALWRNAGPGRKTELMGDSLELEMPEPLRKWVFQQAARHGYKAPADYVCEILELARLSDLRQRIDEQLTKGLSSGPSTPMTAADWQRIRESIPHESMGKTPIPVFEYSRECVEG